MKKAVKNTFVKGMNKDLDKHTPQNEVMYDNKNFRLITQEGQSNILLENVKGNDELKTENHNQLQAEQDFIIIGHYVFDNKDIVLFAISNQNGINNLPLSNRIYLYKYDNNEYLPRITLYSDNNNDSHLAIHPNYQLGLQLKEKISCIGRDETNYIRKVYWTDNTNSVRQVNIAPDIDDTTGLPKDGNSTSDYTRIQEQESWEFDLIGKLQPTTITFDGYGQGNLMTGKVQYAVRYFNLNGNSSNYQTDVKLIPVPTKYGNTSLELEGDGPNVNSNKSIELTINVSDNTRYDYVQIYGIYYYDNTNIPTIKTIVEKQITSDTTTINITDTGSNYIGEITLDELRYIRSNYIAKTLDRKDDRLFIGNITEDYFDVDYDARAYRFSASTGTQSAVIYNSADAIEDTINGASPSYPTDETLDAINKYNDFTGTPASYPYMYKADGITLGGEGLNVNYWFVNINNKTDDDYKLEGKFQTSNVNDVFLGIKRGFQRDEIYRFGVIFTNNKGQTSFTKWIGDIRTPSVNDGFWIASSFGGSSYIWRLQIRFDINNIPLNDDGSNMNYTIVYVARQNYTKTVLTAGWMTNTTPLLTSSGALTYNHIFKRDLINEPYFNSTSYDLLEYTSADIDMNDINLNNIYIQLNNYKLGEISSKDVYRDNSTTELLYKYIKYSHASNITNNNFFKIDESLRLNTQHDFKVGIDYIYTLSTVKTPMYAPKLYNIEDKYIISPITTTISSAGSPDLFENRYVGCQFKSYSNMISPFVFKPELNLSLPSLSDKAVYTYVRRKIIPYGGHSYSDRLLNQYIPASDINNGYCDYGDTYVGHYDRIRTQLTRTYADRQWVGKSYDWGSILWKGKETTTDGTVPNDKYAQSQGYSQYIAFVQETSIILPLQHGFSINKEYSKDESRLVSESNNIFEITEEVLVDATGTDKTTWVTEVVNYPDMFLYNPIYSKLSDAQISIMKPQFWQQLINFPTRIRFSDIKFNGEQHDSWTEFRSNNMQDVDTKYGGIQQLVNWKNYLFAFQSRGFCMLPVNEQATTTTTQGSPVVLGKGDVLPKIFNYASGSEKYGLQNDNQVMTTEQAIYWIDGIEKKILKFSGNTMELNFITGMSSWIRDNVDETVEYVTGYDNQFKEILFSINGVTDTLVYNELLSAFQGFYTFNTTRYLMIPELVSVEDDRLLWEHNIGVRTSWYDDIDASEFEIIVNDQTGVTKEFNNIEYASESFTENTKVDNYQDTLNYIQAYNDYSNTTSVELLPYLRGDTLYTGGLSIPAGAPTTIKNIRRRERLWRTTIPRVDSSNTIIDNYRMRDIYVRLKFIYNNDNGYQFIMHPLTTYYTLSNIE